MLLHKLQSGGMDGMYTQRKNERRCLVGKTSFPLVTKEGHEVEKDRRCTPDRRSGDIHLELTDVAEHRLSEYFSDVPFLSSGNNSY